MALSKKKTLEQLVIFPEQFRLKAHYKIEVFSGGEKKGRVIATDTELEVVDCADRAELIHELSDRI